MQSTVVPTPVLVIVPPGRGRRALRTTLRSLAAQRLRPEAVVVARGWFDGAREAVWPGGLRGDWEMPRKKISMWLADVIRRHPRHAVAFAPRGQLGRADKLSGALAALAEAKAQWLFHATCASSPDYLADARARGGALTTEEADWGRLFLSPEIAQAWADALADDHPASPQDFATWATRENRAGLERPEGWQIVPSAQEALSDFSNPLIAPPGPPLADFRDRAKGRRGFVVGNGPSLRKMDLSKLRGEIVGASNRFFLLFPQLDWRPTFYSCIDTQVLPDQAAELAAARLQAPETHFFFPREIVDDETWKLRWSVPSLVPPDERTCYFAQRPPAWTDEPFDAFARDPAAGLVAGLTVTVTLLQLAVLYGCNPIYLLGCDHKYLVPSTAESSPAQGGGPGLLRSTADDDPNHFSPAYFGRGRLWHQPNLEGMERHYAAARLAAAKMGLEIINAGVDSELEIFPKVEFGGLF